MKFGLSLKALSNRKILVALVSLLVLLSPLNHKELFSVYTWSLLPVRFVLFLVILSGGFLFLIKRKLVDSVFIILLGLSAFLTLSTLVAENKLEALLFSAFYISLPFLYLIFKYLYLSNKTLVNRFIDVYIFSFVLSLVFLAFQIIYYYTTNKLIGAVWPVPNNVPRFGSVFWDINHYGAFIVINIWLVAYRCYVNWKNKKAFSLYTFLLLISLCALVLTSSRSSMLGLLSGLIVFKLIYISYFRDRLKKLTFKVASTALVFLPFLIYIVSSILGTFVRNFFFYRIHSFFTHFILLRIGFDLFKQNPILGIGANNFSYALKNSPYYSEFALLDPGALDYKIPVHSVWMHFLAEGGIFTFATFCIVVLFTIYLLYKKVSKEKDILSLFLLSSFIAILVSGIFYSYNLEFYWVYFVFVVLYSYAGTKFSKKVLLDFKNVFFSVKTLSIAIVTFSFIYIFSHLDSVPSYSEVIFFNQSKLYETFMISEFTKVLTYKYQYMFGYFPYVSRLAPLTFFVSIISILFLTLKNMSTYSRLFLSLVIVTFIFALTNAFSLNNISYNIYFFALVFFVASYIYSVPFEKRQLIVEKRWVHFILAIMILIFSVISFYRIGSYSYLPDVSKLTNSLARKYSLNNFEMYAKEPDYIVPMSFYLEPDNMVFLQPEFNGKDFIYITNSPVTFQYDREIHNGDVRAYLKFYKVNVP